MATIQLQLLGHFYLRFDGEPVTTLPQGRLHSLLAYLALQRHIPQSRQHLAYLFWPDSTEAQARTNLRHLLHELRLALPGAEQFLVIHTQWIQWHPDIQITLDVSEFEELLAQADSLLQRQRAEAALAALERVVELYQGPFLRGAYDEWVLEKRQMLEECYAQALTGLIALQERRGNYPVAIGYAQRLLRHDPLTETTYQQLMRLHALHGDRASALRVFHECAAMLERELGVEPSAETRAAHAQLLKLDATSSVSAEQPARTAETQELVGRQREWEQLRLAWQRASHGHLHVVSLTGEAGIGKTRLAEDFSTWVRRQGFRTASTRAYEAEGGLAFAPLIELLRSETLAPEVAQLSERWLVPIAILLPEVRDRHPHLAQVEALAEPVQRQHFYEALARALLGDGQPLLLNFDDMQWCDRETLEWLRYLLHFAPHAQLLIVMTVRAGDVAADHPLHNFMLNLRRQQLLSELPLEPLNQEQTATLAVQLAGRTLAADQAARLYHHTEGNPFFVVEMVRADIANLSVGSEQAPNANEFEALRERWSTRLSLPDRVKAVIQARLSQLTSQAQEIAQLAATIGRSFSLDMLAHASSYSDDDLVRSLDELWQRHILREQGASEYDFSHPLIRSVAYAQTSPMRRRIFHRRIAQTLESFYQDELDSISGLSAIHYELAGDHAQAVHAYQRAARFAKQAYASAEAAATLRKALLLLETLPDNRARQRQSLELYLDLGWALMMAKGWSDQEAQQAYDRALALCKSLETNEDKNGERHQEIQENDAHMYEAIWGLHEIYLFQGNRDKALEASEICWKMAHRSGDPEHLLQTHHAFWAIYYYFNIGPNALQSCVDHAQMGIDLYSPKWHRSHVLHYGGHDPCVCAHVVKAKAEWLLGYPDQALQTIQHSLALALQLQHPFAIRQSLLQAAKIHGSRGEPHAILDCIKQVERVRYEHIPERHNLEAQILQGWALGQLGQTAEGTPLVREACSQRQEQGAYLELPYFLALLAETYAHGGQVEMAQRVIQQAQEIAAQTQEDHYQPELYRLSGEYLLAAGDTNAAQSSFLRAIEIAQAQHIKSLELRAVMSLSQLWAEQGQRAQAYDLLSSVYNWFTEGFDTADLRKAKAMLLALT